MTFLADVPEQSGGSEVFDAVHIETLCVAGCDVFNAQLAQQLQQAKVIFLIVPVIDEMKRSNPTRNTQRASVARLSAAFVSSFAAAHSHLWTEIPTFSRVRSSCNRVLEILRTCY